MAMDEMQVPAMPGIGTTPPERERPVYNYDYNK